MISQHGGSLDFNCYGLGGCVQCGWRGAPTTTGGERVGPPRRYWRGLPPGSRVVESVRSDECPSCGESYALKLRPPIPLFDLDEYGGERHQWLVTRIAALIRDGHARRVSPKVGRNDPCPCESGRKFKKCCGAAA